MNHHHWHMQCRVTFNDRSIIRRTFFLLSGTFRKRRSVCLLQLMLRTHSVLQHSDLEHRVSAPVLTMTSSDDDAAISATLQLEWLCVFLQVTLQILLDRNSRKDRVRITTQTAQTEPRHERITHKSSQMWMLRSYLSPNMFCMKQYWNSAQSISSLFKVLADIFVDFYSD